MSRRVLLVILLLIASMSWSVFAGAQDADPAVRACLLLRSPAECGVVYGTPFYAPGDMETSRVLMPDPFLRQGRAGASQRDSFTPLRGDAGMDTIWERTRQVINLPLRWTPFRALSAGADVPLVAQAPVDKTEYSVGDTSLLVKGRWLGGPVSASLDGLIKLPTGSRDKWSGTGKADGSSLVQAWVTSGLLAFGASGAYRNNGFSGDQLVQESITARLNLKLTTWAELGIQARLFGHHRLSPGEPARNSMQAAFGIEPELLGLGVAYAYALIPVHEDARKSGLLIQAGVSLPFGRSSAPPTPPVPQVLGASSSQTTP